MSRFLEALAAPGGVIPGLANLVSSFVDRKSARESSRRKDRNEAQANAFRNRQQGLLEQRFALQQDQAQAQQEARITKAKTDQANAVAKHKREQAENLAGAIEDAHALDQKTYNDAADIVSGNSLYENTEGTKGTWHPKEVVDSARAVMARKFPGKPNASDPASADTDPAARIASLVDKGKQHGTRSFTPEEKHFLSANRHLISAEQAAHFKAAHNTIPAEVSRGRLAEDEVSLSSALDGFSGVPGRVGPDVIEGLQARLDDTRAALAAPEAERQRTENMRGGFDTNLGIPLLAVPDPGHPLLQDDATSLQNAQDMFERRRSGF